jgi:hypothetical protein
MTTAATVRKTMMAVSRKARGCYRAHSHS